MRAAVLLVLVLGACDSADTATDAGRTPSPDAAAHAPDTGAVPMSATDSAAPDVHAPYVDPLQCHLLCASADGADCANAPDHQTCFDLCERAIDRCPALVAALLACFGPVPIFVCDAEGNLASTDCAAELERVQQCAAQSDGG